MPAIAPRRPPPRNMPRLPQRHRYPRHYAPYLPLKPHDRRRQQVIHAVLAIHHHAVGRQHPLDEMRRPLRIIRLHRQKDDVKRLPYLPRVRQMNRVHRRREIPLTPRRAQPVGVHRIYMRPPHINQRNVIPLPRQKRADITPRRARAKNRYPLILNIAHLSLPRLVSPASCARPSWRD